MLVVATKRGYYNRVIREPGDVFEFVIKQSDFKKNGLGSWMEVAPKAKKVEDETESDPLD